MFSARFARAKHRSPRRALTLTELLVVVAIIVTLTTILLPLVQPVLRGQRVREAARQVSVMMTTAQAKAVSTGRPAGVWIERAAHEPTPSGTGDPRWYTSYRLYPAEQPKPYRGDVFDARVTIKPVPGSPSQWAAFFQDPQWPDPSRPQLPCCGMAWRMLEAGIPFVRPGDLIRFQGRGDFFLITRIDADKFAFLAPPVVVNGTPQPDPDLLKLVKSPPNDPSQAPAYQSGVAFEIMRRPTKSPGAPLELPNNTGIDLSVSGYTPPFQAPFTSFGLYTESRALNPGMAGAARFREISPEYDIVIMFQPNGSVDRVWYIAHEERIMTDISQVQPDDLLPLWEVPHGDMHLLVARDEQIGQVVQNGTTVNLAADYINNVNSPLGTETLRATTNTWVGLSTESGRVITGPNANAFTNDLAQPVPNNWTLPDYLRNARRLLDTGRSVGGQ